MVESGAGAPTLGFGGNAGAFATGLRPAPLVAFPVPRSPNPACRFPAPGSPVGSCTSHTGDKRTTAERMVWPHGCRPQVLHATRPHCHGSLVGHQTGARPDGLDPNAGECTDAKEPPFTSASDASRLSGILRGNRPCHSRRLSPFGTSPHLGSLSSTGITRRLQSYGPLRHPASCLACPSRGSS